MRKIALSSLVVLFVLAITSSANAQVEITWEKLPGKAKDIAANSKGMVWIIGTNGTPYIWNDSNYEWDAASGSAAKITLSPSNDVFIVNDDEKVYRKRGKNWQELPGRAIDIEAGQDGSVWILGKNNVPHKWDESKFEWVAKSGKGRRITIMTDGTPVVSNANNEVFIQKGDNWSQLPGRAGDVSAGKDGALYAIGANGGPLMWSENDYDWVKMSGTAKKIAVGGEEAQFMFIVNDKNEIFKGRVPVADAN